MLFELEKICEGFDKIVLSATLKNQSYFSFCALVHSHHCISIVKLTCFLPVREERKNLGHSWIFLEFSKLDFILWRRDNFKNVKVNPNFFKLGIWVIENKSSCCFSIIFTITYLCKKTFINHTMSYKVFQIMAIFPHFMYRLFFLRSIAQFCTQIYIHCFVS